MLNLFFEFEVLVREGSYSEAAETLNMAQSTLSKHIIKLENHLGIRIINRTPYGIAVTPAGQRILNCVSDLRASYDQIQRIVREEQARNAQTLSILSAPFASYYNMPKTIADFSSKYPDFDIVFSEDNFKSEALLNGSYDFAFSYVMEDMDNYFDYIPYCKESIVAAVSSSHRLADKNSVKIEQLKDEVFISSSQSQVLNSVLGHLASEAGFEPKLRHFSALRFESMLNLVECNVGIAIMMRQFIEKSHFDIVGIEFDPPIDRTVYLLWKKGKKLSKHSRKFIDFIGGLYDKTAGA